MNIAIVGAGNVGSALAKAWAKAGHRIFIGTRDSAQPELAPLLASLNITAHAHLEAVSNAEVVLFAIPSAAFPTVLSSLGSLKGKVLIDATNAVREKPTPYANGYDALKVLSGSTDIVKCFNSTGYENMTKPIADTKYGSIPLDMFMAGASPKAKEIARALALDAGFEACYDFGGEDKVPLLEHFAFAWINLAIMQKEGRGIGFKILKRL